MSPAPGNDGSTPQTWSARIMAAFTGPPSSGGSGVKGDPPKVLPPEERKAAMSTLDPSEAKWALLGIAPGDADRHRIPGVLHRGEHLDQSRGKYLAVSPDAAAPRGRHPGPLRPRVLGPLEAEAHTRRLRSVPHRLRVHAYSSALSDSSSSSSVGSLMLRAWRLNKYGTTNSKLIAREAAARPRGRQRKEAARSTSKATAGPAGRKPPTASKRYTPKAPPRKKIPKNAE